MTERIEIGPQSKSDNDFASRMRPHQSWYRAHVLKVRMGSGLTQRQSRPMGIC